MKSLIKMILFIPRLLLTIVWHFFWGMVKTVLVLAVIVFGFLYFANNSNSQFADTISDFANAVTSYFENTSSEDLTTAISELSTDDFTHYTGARWSKNEATVYIETKDATLVSAYEQAIANWNATGAFTFTLVNDSSQADIIATEYSDASSEAAGLAEMETNAVTNHLTSVRVLLNSYYLVENDYGYTMDRIVHTAEHELGHAIGLNHDDNENSVMQSSGSFHGIQATDIVAVQALYSG